MTIDLSAATFALFVIFCRIGGALMTMPGFGSERIPVRVRLFVAIGVTTAIAPSLWTAASEKIDAGSVQDFVAILVTETVIGIMIGLSARMFILALEGMATAASMSIGLGNVLGIPINESEPIPPLATAIVLGAVTLIFVLDLHWELIRGLRQSYDVIALGAALNAEFALTELIRAVDVAFSGMLRMCSPMLLFGLILNVSFGLLNRMSPQVPIYFISAPFLLSIGLFWFYMLTPDFFTGIGADFGAFLRQ